MPQPAEILQHMLANDKFSKWLGLEIIDFRLGYCKLKFVVTGDMLNGFDIVHGGVLFAAADSAFAFACNSQGVLSVALDVTISFVKPARAGNTIVVEAREVSTGNKVSFYDVSILDTEGKILAIFKGTAFRTDRDVLKAQ